MMSAVVTNRASVQGVLRFGMLAIGTIFLIVALSSLVQAQVEQANSSDFTPAELIARLQSDWFSIRQKSMFEIMENPEPMIPLIESAIESADGDFRIRSLKLLEQIALKKTSSTSASNLAFDAIRRISLSGNDALSRRASRSAYDILLYRQYSAALKLERLNARISYLAIMDNEKHPLATELTIDHRWKGTRLDLEQVPHLLGLSTIEMNHAQVDDDLVAQLDSIYTLTGIRLKKCSITDASIHHMSQFDSLNEVEILYCPVSPGCFESLTKFKRLSSLRLIGTDVDPSNAGLLEQRLSATIDIRRGAFMGIRYSPTSPECRLTSLVPGSGAEQAGLRVGDQIIEFNRTPVIEHEDLTKLLREKASGDKAKVKVKRNGEVLTFDVLMGEWE